MEAAPCVFLQIPRGIRAIDAIKYCPSRGSKGESVNVNSLLNLVLRRTLAARSRITSNLKQPVFVGLPHNLTLILFAEINTVLK